MLPTPHPLPTDYSTPQTFEKTFLHKSSRNEERELPEDYKEYGFGI